VPCNNIDLNNLNQLALEAAKSYLAKNSKAKTPNDYMESFIATYIYMEHKYKDVISNEKLITNILESEFDLELN